MRCEGSGQTATQLGERGEGVGVTTGAAGFEDRHAELVEGSGRPEVGQGAVVQQVLGRGPGRGRARRRVAQRQLLPPLGHATKFEADCLGARVDQDRRS